MALLDLEALASGAGLDGKRTLRVTLEAVARGSLGDLVAAVQLGLGEDGGAGQGRGVALVRVQLCSVRERGGESLKKGMRSRTGEDKVHGQEGKKKKKEEEGRRQ